MVNFVLTISSAHFQHKLCEVLKAMFLVNVIVDNRKILIIYWMEYKFIRNTNGHKSIQIHHQNNVSISRHWCKCKNNFDRWYKNINSLSEDIPQKYFLFLTFWNINNIWFCVSNDSAFGYNVQLSRDLCLRHLSKTTYPVIISELLLS